MWTAEEVYAMWKNEPKKVHILVSHGSNTFSSVMRRWQRNIPLLDEKHEWNPDTKQFVVESTLISSPKRNVSSSLPKLSWSCAGPGPQRNSSQRSCKIWFCERLQYHRWHGRGYCGRSKKQTPRKEDEERLEKLRIPCTHEVNPVADLFTGCQKVR